MRKNKGITLIALIITIIILLILVGVSVNLLIKGDLFGSAEKAVNGTNAKVEEQQTRVDELMDKLDKANTFLEGTEPKLKYEVFGNEIVIYLENSIYDYVLQKSINEKEKQLAEEWFETSSIEDVIKNEFNNDRKQYEDEVINEANKRFEEDWNLISTYEGALNYIISYSYETEYSCTEFPKKILNINNNLKSDGEKEEKLANILGITIDEVHAGIQELAQDLELTYSQALDAQLFMLEIKDQNSIDEFTRADHVKITLPNKENDDIQYCEHGFTIYKVETSGNYKFIAENYKGKKSELTVPINEDIFKIKVSDDDIRTYVCFNGQTWEQFIGSSGEKTTNDGSLFAIYDNDEITLRN